MRVGDRAHRRLRRANRLVSAAEDSGDASSRPRRRVAEPLLRSDGLPEELTLAWLKKVAYALDADAGDLLKS